MQRFTWTLFFVVIFACSAWAQDVSTQDMDMATSDQFGDRIVYLAYTYAGTVYNEAASVPCYTKRLNLATLILQSPGRSVTTARLAVAVVHNNVAGAVITGTHEVDGGTGEVDSSATDTAIANAIEDQWNLVALCLPGD